MLIVVLSVIQNVTVYLMMKYILLLLKQNKYFNSKRFLKKKCFLQKTCNAEPRCNKRKRKTARQSAIDMEVQTC